jgi:hypothetical protein
LIEKVASSGSTVVEHMSHHPGHDLSFEPFLHIFTTEFRVCVVAMEYSNAKISI